MCFNFAAYRMQLNSVVIRTKDIEKSIEFYEEVLNFTFDSLMSASPYKRIAFLTDPESVIHLELIDNENAKVVPQNCVSLTFKVDQISEAEKYLREKKVRIITSPRTVKDGKKILTAVDPNGVELNLLKITIYLLIFLLYFTIA